MILSPEYFNLFKASYIIPAILLSLFITFYKVNKKMYIFITCLIWLLVALAISVKNDAKHMVDFDMKVLIYALLSSFALVMGTIFFIIYDKRYRIYYHLYVFGIILFVIGKTGIISIDLGLINYTQFLVILSTALVVIGNLIELLNLKGKGKIELYKFGKFMLVIGWMLFGYNVIHNPPNKKIADIVKIQK